VTLSAIIGSLRAINVFKTIENQHFKTKIK